MKKLGRFLSWLVLLLVLALLSWGLALYLDWPPAAALAIFLAILGVGFLAVAARRIFIVMRSRSKLTHVSERERAKAAKQVSPQALLIKKWKEAVASLRRSSLRRQGNPLYVLPWYMVIGKSGAGKTTALTRARLASSIQKVSQKAAVQQTANCDWWFFDKAVVLDCAGRYVDAESREADKREWEVNLDLLAKYRAREGLNGLVLAIDAERLLNPDFDTLDEEGRVIRDRIDQLIRLFGKRFPIYVLVTKCDRLYGLESWAAMLPKKALEQAMGYLSQARDKELSETEFLDAAFASIGERLRHLRLGLAARSADISPELLLFPNELERLRPALRAFLRTCLGESPYLESPFLRGLFFSSGRQEGGAVSSVLGNVLPPAPVHAERNDGLFLHDLFDRILPQDRNIARPALLVNPWYRVTQNLGLTAWLLLTAAAATLMTVSFVNNIGTINAIRDTYPFNSQFTGKLEDDAATLEHISDALIRIEQNNHRWQTLWMVIATNMDELEQRLKQSFVTSYRRYVQSEKDRDLDEDVAYLLREGSDTPVPPQLMLNLTRRINHVLARLDGADRAELAAMPRGGAAYRYSPQMYRRFSQLHLSHLAWSSSDDPYLQRRLLRDREYFERLSAAFQPRLAWTVDLARAQVQDVTAASFWTDTVREQQRAGKALPTVPAGFTAAGRAVIDAILAEIEAGAEDAPRFMQQRAAFEHWYAERRLKAWQEFVAEFPRAEGLLRGEPEWRTALGTMAGAHNNYYRLIERLNEEFKDLPDQALPDWLRFARQFSRLLAQVRTVPGVDSAAKVVGTINAFGGEAIKEAVGGRPGQGGEIIRASLEAVETLRAYLADVGKIAAEATQGPAGAYRVAADFHAFSRDPKVTSSAGHLAANSLATLRRQLDHSSPDSELIWHLVEGPFRFVLSYTQQQASCLLQQEWDAMVQWPLRNAAESGGFDQLFGQGGSVWAFADGPAKPFLARDAGRFGAVETLGFSMPFTRQFLTMLDGAVGMRVEQLSHRQRSELAKNREDLRVQAEREQAQLAVADADRVLASLKQRADEIKTRAFPLTITGQPTSVDPGAKSRPYATVLTMQCAAGARTLTNFNFPVSESFAWSHNGCGEVKLEIKIDNLVLTKRYPGALGLVEFLRDFRDGQRRFHADEFPAAAADLKALGIRQLDLRYRFEGNDAILAAAAELERLDAQSMQASESRKAAQHVLATSAQRQIELKSSNGQGPSFHLSIPARIAACWDEGNLPRERQTLDGLIKQLVDEKLAAPNS